MYARALLGTLTLVTITSISVCDLARGQGCPSGSSSATVTVSNQFGPQASPWSHVLDVPQFDPSPGQVLLRADVTFIGAVQGSTQFENASTTGSCTVSWQLTSILTIATPVHAHPNETLQPSVTGRNFLAPFDGTVDYRGPSGASNMGLTASDQVAISVTDPGVLASVFSGSGAIHFDASSLDDCSHSGLGNGYGLIIEASSIRITIDYTYCSAGVDFCVPGIGAVMPCPCGNPQQPAGSTRGCNNSSATGGALLQSGGAASLASDSVVFTSSGEKPTATTIFLQGDASLASGVVFGQGVRCNGGALERLYVKSASGGVASAPSPGDPSVSARSAALGDAITPGTHRYYSAYYRDATVLGGCPSTSTFNASQGQDVTWAP
jgi:hypothetical protein